MSNISTKENLKRWRRGQKIDAAGLNQMVDATNLLLGGVRAPSQQRRGGRGNSVGATAQIFEVIAIDFDYVRCYAYDSVSNTTEDVETRVALPYLLRSGPFDGETRNGISYVYDETLPYSKRVATDADSNTETQVIVPGYVEGDLIIGVRGIAGGTNAFYLDDQGALQPIAWLDLNTDSRAWAEEA